MSVNGLILVDKPTGYTSRQVTSIISKICREKRAGHLGTLDPLATGLLPVLIGKATRLAPFLESDQKEYQAKVKLGETTDTMDSEGTLLASAPVPELTGDQIIPVLQKFMGEIDQHPPMFSAVKHQGQRLYDLARKGEVVETKTRKVTIFEIRLDGFDGKTMDIFVQCSPGTYIRVLANDIGKDLGCGAHLTGLSRLKSGKFSRDKAVELSILTNQNYSQYLIQLEDIMDFEKVGIPDEFGYRLRDGNPVPLESIISRQIPAGTLIRVFSKPCFAICELIVQNQEPYLRPLKVFPNEGL